MIRSFVDRLFGAGTPRVLTDPAPDNHRAIRAYEKAGFRQIALVETPDGRSLLMKRDA
jgi:aminoglycoside 6'-N-acetyltransferase